MYEIKLKKSREEIEQQLKEMDLELIYQWKDDQIWVNKKENYLLWISWINMVCKHFKLVQEINMV